MISPLRICSTAILLGLALFATGCHHNVASAPASPPVPIPTPTPFPSNAELTSAKVNEAGDIPILEYHELVDDSVTPHMYQYRKSDFRKDMELMYSQGYRPINLTELVTGHINCPIGCSPFVITFDDALRGQLDYTDDGKIDPTCGVGILQSIHAEHPDWRLAGTFFVLPAKGSATYFYQADSSKQKLNWLATNGFELGNHTVHHLMGMRSWDDNRVQSEFAIAAKMIDDNVPGYKVDLLALPYGIYPKKIALVESGSYNGLKYSNICALRAGAGPAYSPVTKDWNPYRIQRIIPGSSTFTIHWWLDYFQKHKDKRYVSDGIPDVITVPTYAASDVLPTQLQKLGLTLHTY